MPKRILVTGASGQLGKTIEVLYSKKNKDLDFVFVSKQELDITEASNLERYFKSNNFDYCINCAAYTNVEQAEKTPEIAYKVNAIGVKNLAKACKLYDIFLIHISTDYVFDGEKKEPYLTTDIPNPINEYGKSKLEGERFVQKILTNYYIIRTSWLYSKEFGKNFYKTILVKAKTEKELRITNAQKGCPTDTVNLAKYVLDLIINRKEDYAIHHFSDEQVMSWYDFAQQILIENSLSDTINLVEVGNYRTFARRPKNSILYMSQNTL